MPICSRDWTWRGAAGRPPALGGGRRPAAGLQPSTSRRMMRPWGPDPFTVVRSTPVWAARRCARGEAKMRGESASFVGAASPRRLHRLRRGWVGADSRWRRFFLLSPLAGGPARRSRRLRGAAAGAAPLAPPPLSRAIGVLTLTAFGPFRNQDGLDHALVHRLHLHGRLVGLDLGDDVAGLHRVSHLHQPLGQSALLHGRRQSRHQNVGHEASFERCARSAP